MRQLIFVWTVLLATILAATTHAADMRVYFGTYTRGKDSQGIYTCLMDAKTGKLHSLELAAEADNPSFVALHPSKPLLYSVGEVDDYEGKSAGSVCAFEIDESTGKLQLINRVSSHGAAPCHIVVDAAGKHVLTANYSAGNANINRIKDDGGLGEQTGFTQHTGSSVNKSRQEAPHAHSINLDKANKFAFVADLGIDQIKVYRYNLSLIHI